MSFVKKTFLYPFFLFILSLQTGYAQEFVKPTLLLKNIEGYQFYSFENNTLSLYNINQNAEYFKIWEYKFLNHKEAELISILHGDIKGGPSKELIVMLHSFGSKGELYIFSIKDTFPEGTPEILQLPTTKKGTRPTQAQLINWDQQKKQEILLMFSSPERELLVLDYYNNNLSVITRLASDFLSSTYGPIRLFTTDQNKDGIDDILIYSTNEQTKQYTLLSTKEENSRTLIQNISFSSIQLFNKNTIADTYALLKNTNTIYSINQEKKINTNTQNIKSIIDVSNQDIIVFTDDNRLILLPHQTQKHPPENTMLELKIKNKKTNYITDLNNTAAIFSNLDEQKLILVVLRPTPTQTLLAEGPPSSAQPISRKEDKKTKDTPLHTKTEKHDTLYVNVGTEIIISIPKEESLNIESVETHKKPETMVLNPKTLEFIWTPDSTDKGTQKFEYSVSYISESKLEQTTTKQQQLSLKNTFTKTNTIHQYDIYINDIPELVIENIRDTIHSTGFFESFYKINDNYHIQRPLIKTTERRNNNILINNTTLYWEPERLDVGEQTFLIIADDGMAQDSATVFVFVDTTVKKTAHDTDFIITVNESFTHQLPYTKETNYNIVQGPENLRISQKGKVHWVPIITQVDLNKIIILTTTAQEQTEHTLNVYVNAPPVISYQPATQEAITQGEKFQFQFQSFDMNTDATLQWNNITNQETSPFILNQFGMLEFDSTQEIDNFRYIVHLNDKMDTDVFVGQLYVNFSPKILSVPDTHIGLGETYKYIVITEDKNQEKPYQENQQAQLFYQIHTKPEGVVFNNTDKTLLWTPTQNQIGKNLFKIVVTDSIDTAIQEFSVFVNDKPNIVSPDSLSIMLGDTLFHYFDAQDLNQDSELLYTIKTTIDEILFSGKSGKLVWVPKEEDLGFHTLEISVSDGFNTGTDMQKLKIFVYKNPVLANTPKEEAFVNMEYRFIPKGHDMFNDSLPNQDIMFNIISTDSLFKGRFDSNNNIFKWTPSLDEIGEKNLLITISDKYKHQQTQTYPVTVMLSPCETLQAPCAGLDTLIINQTDTIEKTIIDSIFIEKKDTVYIDKKQPENNNRKKWKPKGLGF